MCDRAFPGRDGWFGECYAESRTWIATPPWFRSWVEHEQQAATLRIWQLGVLSGLLQTEQYARGILTVEPGVTDDQVCERLAARLARQAVLTRDDPPAAWFLVDEAVLHRWVGPAIAHAGPLGGFAVAERAAYVETAVAGQVFEDADIIAGLLTRVDTLRNEALRGSEALALLERMCTEWTAPGARAVTQVPTAANA